MSKKVVDIISPQKKEKEKISLVAVKKDLPLIRVKRNKINFVHHFSRSKGKFFLGGGILIAILLFCFFNLPRAEVKIWPETQKLTLQAEVTIDKDSQGVDLEKKLIGGEIFEKEKILTENFSATGNATKEGKAKGMIRVYNEYSTTPQVLVATTRFISSGGLLFRTPVKVTVPGGTNEKGKFVAGYIDIEVVADEPGPEFNIGPSTFSVPGFAGTDRYTKFYAKSFQPMSGGFVEGASLATKDDLKNAEESVIKKAKSEIEASIKEELNSGENGRNLIFFENAIQSEVLDSSSSVAANTETNNFDFQTRVKAKTLVFKKDDLKKFVEDFVLSKSPENYKLYEDNLKIIQTPKTISAGKITLSLNISATVYFDINTSDLKESVSGKSLAGSRVFLQNQPGVVKVLIDYWPFWVKKAPQDVEKIRIDLAID